MSEELAGCLAETRAAVDAALDRWMPRSERPGDLPAAMRHIVFAGGKRLRPALVVIGSLDVGGTAEAALAPAVAVELVHAYSLVHDDLPCMDDAPMRRGRPCVHVLHGEAMGVLAGDALQTLAFEVLARESGPGAPVSAMVVELARAVGWDGMVGGQVDDLRAEGAAPDRERVRRIHLGKTAALLAACLRLGGLAGGGGPAEVERLGSVGTELGLAFQIVDDLLDLEQPSESLGKEAGADARAGKMTWPAAVGRESARRDAEGLLASARRQARGGRAAGLLDALAGRILERRS